MMNSNQLVLLVEDNFDHAELVKIAIENNGFKCNIVHLSDGKQVLDYFFGEDTDKNKSFNIPDLVLLDLRMPKVSGLEVLKELKSHNDTKQIPVVILTSSNNKSDLDFAYSNYVNSYLVKPMEFEEYNNIIKEIGDYWLSLNIK